MILDATCSRLRIWPKEADVRIDITRSARPDVQADARRLPFKDACFSAVYCDPPHLVIKGKASDRVSAEFRERARGYGEIDRFDRFSAWPSKAIWYDFCEKTNIEFARVLADYGMLFYKIPNGKSSSCINVQELLDRMTNFELRRDESVKSRGFFSRMNEKRGRPPTMIHYLALRKKSTPVGLPFSSRPASALPAR
jgi:hypothetical protein